MLTYFQRLRAFPRDIRLFLVTPALIGFTVFGGIYTVLFNLYLARLGYEPTFIGLVNASSQFALAIFALPASALGLRLGTRPTMIWGMSLVVIGHAAPVLAEFAPVGLRQGWLLGSYLLGGLGLALYFVNASPWVMAMTAPGERSHVFSVQAALWPLAGFVGSLIGGLLPTFILC
jgi:MFS family permease